MLINKKIFHDRCRNTDGWITLLKNGEFIFNRTEIFTAAGCFLKKFYGINGRLTELWNGVNLLVVFMVTYKVSEEHETLFEYYF